MDEASRAKRHAAAAVAATAAIGSAAVSATLAQPAMAAHPKDTCPGNTLCEWADANFEGPVKWWGRSSRRQLPPLLLRQQHFGANGSEWAPWDGPQQRFIGLEQHGSLGHAVQQLVLQQHRGPGHRIWHLPGT
jgi:hypothetical protein